MDRVFQNGKIYSLDAADHVYTALGVKDGRIAFLGSDAEAAALSAKEKIDLQGNVMLPGFIDSHLHMLNYAFVKCSYNMTEETSLLSILTRGREIASSLDAKGDSTSWIYGRGWNEVNFTSGEQNVITRQDLDQVSGTHPILFIRICGHIAAVNTKALEIIEKLDNMCEFSEEIDYETGVISEGAVKLCYDAMTEPSVEQIKTLIRSVQGDYSACGITSLQSDNFLSLPGRNAHRIMQAYKELAESGELNVKVREQASFLNFKEVKAFIDEGHKMGEGSEYYYLGPVKLYIDGSLGARTALMREPYEGCGSNCGIMRHSLEDLQRCVDYSYDHDMQILIHAIGDRAADIVMNAYENTINKYGEKPVRLAINHLQIASEDLFDRMAEYGILAYIQPIFVSSDKSIVGGIVGEKRASHSYMWKTMLDKGLKCCGGSDSPVESFDILQNIQCAVTRDSLTENTEGWHPEEKLTVKEAVRLFTGWNAYGAMEEDIKGSLESGKAADLVVLDRDIFDADPHEIHKIKVLSTFSNGRTVYTAK